jgi:O-antigen/teichoic acid export membrane protein
VQHSAYLERQLRYVTLARIEVMAQFINAAVAILFAFFGAGYWALVLGGMAHSLVLTSALWIATGWLPGPPQRDAPVGALLRFGATVTLNSIVVFFAYNAEKILIGRFWGAAALGIYGRAYQLINIPTASIHVAIGGVALSSLSRLQNDPPRQRRYFLKGYSLLMSVTVPLTVFCAVFGNDIIMVMLGPQWGESVPVFRLLAPTVLIFGLINPLAALMLASGLQRRSLHLAISIAILMLCAIPLGIPYGPTGVAFAISTAMSLWLVPHVVWSLKGTAIAPRDLFATAGKPLLATVAAAALAFMVHQTLLGLEWPIVRLAISGVVMGFLYFGILLFALGESRSYLNFLRGFGVFQPSPP